VVPVPRPEPIPLKYFPKENFHSPSKMISISGMFHRFYTDREKKKAEQTLNRYLSYSDANEWKAGMLFFPLIFTVFWACFVALLIVVLGRYDEKNSS
jgi:hypothetical protein